MSDSGTQRMHDAVRALCSGWTESVEYSVVTTAGVELRVRTRKFEGLLDQLTLMSRMPASMATDGGCNPNKSGSKPPINQAPVNLIDDITQEAYLLRDALHYVRQVKLSSKRQALTRMLPQLVTMCAEIEHTHEDTVMVSVKHAESWVKRARVMLGYQVRETTLVDMVCGNCGGALAVAVDASTDVRCIGAPGALACGTRYPQWTWVGLLG